MKAAPIRNPYRMRRPHADIRFSSPFRFATDKGKPTGGPFEKRGLRVTSMFCWLGPEAVIPIPAIETVEMIGEGRAVRIVYHHVLRQRREEARICFPGLTSSSYNREGTIAFHDQLLSLKREAPTLQEFFSPAGEEDALVQLGCEDCGAGDAALVDLAELCCIGVFPIVGVYSHEPSQPYLCEKHARKSCLARCVCSAVLGSLGFPGFLVAPFTVWGNALSLRRAFPGSSAFAIGVASVSSVIPLGVIAGIVYLALNR